MAFAGVARSDREVKGNYERRSPSPALRAVGQHGARFLCYFQTSGSPSFSVPLPPRGENAPLRGPILLDPLFNSPPVLVGSPHPKLRHFPPAGPLMTAVSRRRRAGVLPRALGLPPGPSSRQHRACHYTAVRDGFNREATLGRGATARAPEG